MTSDKPKAKSKEVQKEFENTHKKIFKSTPVVPKSKYIRTTKKELVEENKELQLVINNLNTREERHTREVKHAEDKLVEMRNIKDQVITRTNVWKSAFYVEKERADSLAEKLNVIREHVTHDVAHLGRVQASLSDDQRDVESKSLIMRVAETLVKIEAKLFTKFPFSELINTPYNARKFPASAPWKQ